MKYAFFIIVSVLLVVSCSVFKRAEQVSSVKKNNQTVQVSTNTTQHTIEWIDTVLILDTDSLEAMSVLSKMDSIPFVVQSNTQSVSLTVKNGILKAKALSKPRKIPVKINKTTDTDIKQNVLQNSQNKENSDVSKKDIKKESLKVSWKIILPIIAVLLLIVILYKKRKKILSWILR